MPRRSSGKTDFVDTSSEQTQASVGSRADDEYDALVDVFDSPWIKSADGRLDGLTVVVKDNLLVKNIEMTCGLAEFSYVPKDDAAVVERVLDEGGAIPGKSNVDAMAIGPVSAWSGLDQVQNPVHSDYYPGGSSSRSGAAVAGGLTDPALGTDTGGSIRKTAIYCELIGIKLTNGRVPKHGLVTYVP